MYKTKFWSKIKGVPERDLRDFTNNLLVETRGKDYEDIKNAKMLNVKEMRIIYDNFNGAGQYDLDFKH